MIGRTTQPMIGFRPMVGRPRSASGFTLMEALVVLLILVIVMAAVVVNVTDIFTSRIVKSSGKIAAMARYAYDQSTLSGEVFRLSIDLSSGAYGLEKVTLPQQCGALGEGFRERDGHKDKDEEEKAAQPTGAAFADSRVRKASLHKSLRFTGVMTQRDKEPVTEGTAYIYFFPDGTAEKAFIWLGKDEQIFTVEIRSLTGGGRVHKEELDPKELSRR